MLIKTIFQSQPVLQLYVSIIMNRRFELVSKTKFRYSGSFLLTYQKNNQQIVFITSNRKLQTSIITVIQERYQQFIISKISNDFNKEDQYFESPIKYKIFGQIIINYFRKLQMLSTQVKQENKCPICFPIDQQVIDVMFNLVIIILRQHAVIETKMRTEASSSCQESVEGAENSIQQLIKFIFSKKFTTLSTCKHQIILQFLATKTKLKKKQLNKVCQLIFQFQAKRNFQLELLTNQVKCFPKTIKEQVNNQSRTNCTKVNLSECKVKKEVIKTFEKQDIHSKDGQEHIPVLNTGMTVFIPYYSQPLQPFYFESFCGSLN